MRCRCAHAWRPSYTLPIGDPITGREWNKVRPDTGTYEGGTITTFKELSPEEVVEANAEAAAAVVAEAAQIKAYWAAQAADKAEAAAEAAELAAEAAAARKAEAAVERRRTGVKGDVTPLPVSFPER